MGVSVDKTMLKNSAEPESDVETREEGEIVDEFETIISSDEELTMRQRIEELEARNKEIEKLEDISGYFDYAKLSSLQKDVGYSGERYKKYSVNSATTPPAPQSRKRKYSSLRQAEREKIYSPLIYKPARRHEYEPSDSFHESVRAYRKVKKRKTEKSSSRGHGMHQKSRRKRTKIEYSSSSDDEELCQLDRDKLRLALRHGPVRVDIVERPIPEAAKEKSPEKDKFEEDVIIVENEKQAEGLDSESEIELQELRLIALKSAFLNNVRERKQRKEMEERKPYSPTDCLQPIAAVRSRSNSPKDFLDAEPLANSPIGSPASLSDECSLHPIDMEIADSSDSASPIFAGQKDRWEPIDRVDDIPLPKRLSDDNRSLISAPRPIRGKVPNVIPFSDENEVVIIKSDNDSPDPSDEEAFALRALLLAQKNSPKYPKDPVKAACKPMSDVSTPTPAEIADPLEAIINIVHGPPAKTAEILKGAVKRFQNRNTSSQIQNVSIESRLQTSDVSSDSSILPMNPEIRLHTSIVPDTNMMATNPFPNDVDHRIPVICSTNFIPVIGNFPPYNVSITSTAQTTEPAKNATVKENIFRPSATRRNTIEIIPITTMPRVNRKSPLTDITKTDNVANDSRSESIKTAKTEHTPVNEESKTDSQTQREEAKTKTSEESQPVSEVPTNKIPPAKAMSQVKKVVSPLKKAVPAPTEATKRQRKRSTTLEALQLKTHNLISSGKLISRNKIVATKLLNKAIMKNTTMPVKRKTFLIRQPSKPTTALQTSRLINSVDVPTVKPLVISLDSKSDSESDDYLVEDSANYSGAIDDNSGLMTDVASPMSLPMDSPRDSPLTISTCAKSLDLDVTPSASTETSQKLTNAKNGGSVVKEKPKPVEARQDGAFQAKLEEFLKKARTKVELSKKVPDVDTGKATIVNKVTKAPSTPAAVRHLPLASQNEYRRLVERMKALEKQKLSRSTTLQSTPKEKTLKLTINNNITTTSPKTTKSAATNQLSALDARNIITSAAAAAKSIEPPTPKNLTLMCTVKNDLCQNSKENAEISKSDSKKTKIVDSSATVVQNKERVVQVTTGNSGSQKPTVTNSDVSADFRSLERQCDTSNSSKNAICETSTPIRVPSTKPSIVNKTRPKTVVEKSIPQKPSTSAAKPGAVKKMPKKSPVPKAPVATAVVVPTQESNSCSAMNITTSKECDDKFQEISLNLLESTSQALQFAVSAQKVFREKLQLQEELNELRKRAAAIETQIKSKETNVAEIITKISSSRASIATLKQQTTYLDKFSVELCEKLGYERHNNLYADQKLKFVKLSRDLLTEIKELKSLQNQGLTKPDTQWIAVSKERRDMAEKSIQVELAAPSLPVDASSNDPITAVSSQIVTNVDSVMVSDGIIPNCDPNLSSIVLESIGTAKEVPVRLATDQALSTHDQSDSREQSPKESDKNDEGCMEEDVPAEERGNISNVSSQDKVLYNRMCVVSEPENTKKSTILPLNNDYESPLLFPSSDDGSLDPNGILCPYQLMGQCDDRECKYNHLQT